jgi:hypothetical protein
VRSAVLSLATSSGIRFTTIVKTMLIKADPDMGTEEMASTDTDKGMVTNITTSAVEVDLVTVVTAVTRSTTRDTEAMNATAATAGKDNMAGSSRSPYILFHIMHSLYMWFGMAWMATYAIGKL